MFGEATTQSRCQTLCSSKVNWKNLIVGSQRDGVWAPVPIAGDAHGLGAQMSTFGNTKQCQKVFTGRDTHCIVCTAKRNLCIFIYYFIELNCNLCVMQLLHLISGSVPNRGKLLFGQIRTTEGIIWQAFKIFSQQTPSLVGANVTSGAEKMFTWYACRRCS